MRLRRAATRLRAWVAWRRRRPQATDERFDGDFALWLLHRPGRRLRR